MTAAECSVFLRKYNEWRRGDAEDNRESEMPHPREIGLAIDAAIQLIEQRDELLAALEEICWSRPLGYRETKYSRSVENIAKKAIASAKGGTA